MSDVPSAARALSLGPDGTWWDRERDADLVCVDVRDETHDVKTFTFRAKADHSFAFSAGQYFVFEPETGSGAEPRCYSASSSALRPRLLGVTVKRVPGGLVSNWLHDTMKPGMEVRAQGPGGSFTVSPATTGEEKFLLLSGGSGVTPLMSIARTFRDAALHPDIVFLHAGRSPRDFVFRDELLFMAKTVPNFRLLFLPERRDNEPAFVGIVGRLSREFLGAAVPDVAERQVMCCGPAPFMAAARAITEVLGTPRDRYREESFDAAVLDEPAIDPVSSGAPAIETFSVTFAKQNKTIEVRADEKVLVVARKNGVRLPASCANGICGTCKSKLVSGAVDMQHNGGIRQREVDAGMFLPCCSKPLSDLVVDR